MNFYEKIFFHQYLDDGEKLIYTMHRHWIVILRRMLEIAVFGMLVPLSLVIFFFQPDSVVAYGLYAWIGIGLIASLYTFADWYSDAWLLTNESIIDVHWDGFFKKSAQRIGYESIESVIYEIKGVKATLFNFGILTITNESGNIVEIENIQQPRKAEAKLNNVRNQLGEQAGKNNLETLKELLADVIEDKLNKRSKGR